MVFVCDTLGMHRGSDTQEQQDVYNFFHGLLNNDFVAFDFDGHTLKTV